MGLKRIYIGYLGICWVYNCMWRRPRWCFSGGNRCERQWERLCMRL